MHADRTNRFALTLIGLLVLLIGAAGMAASVGAFGDSFSRRTLFANIPIPVAMSDGTTVLQPGAVIGALTREVSTYHGVDNTHGRIIGDGAAPELVLEVTARQGADLHALFQRIETEAFAHARQALDKENLPIRLDLDVSRRKT